MNCPQARAIALVGVVRDDDPLSQDEAAALFGDLADCPVLVLAVSGGPDSTALMWLAARWRDGLVRPPKLIAATVDHGLRKEAAREALAVKRLAATLNVAHRTLRWTGRKPKTGIQAAARDARYRLLAQAADAARSDRILAAHTLDDQAETVLFRMMRGSGLDGLGGMDRVAMVPGRSGVQLVRPLLPVPKARLIATLKAANIAYASDPSNDDPRFLRPRLRILMPLLAREGLTAGRLDKLAQRMRRAEQALADAVTAAQRAFGLAMPLRGRLALDAARFCDLPGEIGLRLLQRIINSLGDEGPVELGQLEALYAELRRAGRAIVARGAADRLRRTLAGALVTLSGTKLTVERAPPRRGGMKTGNRGIKAAFTKPR